MRTIEITDPQEGMAAFRLFERESTLAEAEEAFLAHITGEKAVLAEAWREWRVNFRAKHGLPKRAELTVAGEGDAFVVHVKEESNRE